MSGKNTYAILQTCNKVYKEALSAWYKLNRFEFRCTDALADFINVCPVEAFDNIKKLDFYWVGDKTVPAISGLTKFR